MTGGASSTGGAAASATGALGKSFFATLGGKIVIGVAGLAVVGGLGFGGYQLLSRTQPEQEPVAEAPAVSGQAAGNDNIDETPADESVTTEEPTPEPTPTAMPYDQMYVDYLNDHDEINIEQLDPERDGDFGYSLIPLDDDEVPEMVVRYHDKLEMGEDYWYSPWYLDVMTIEDGEVVKLDTDIVTEGWQDGLSLVDSTGDFRYVPSQGHIYADLSGHTTGIGERTLDWEIDKVTHTLLLNVEDEKSTQPDSIPIEFITEKKVVTPDDKSDTENTTDEKEESIYKDEFLKSSMVFKDGEKVYSTIGGFGYQIRTLVSVMDLSTKNKPLKSAWSGVDELDLYDVRSFLVADGYIFADDYSDWGEDSEPLERSLYRIDMKTKKSKRLRSDLSVDWTVDGFYIKNDRLYYKAKNGKNYSVNFDGKDKKEYKGKIKPGKHSPAQSWDGGHSKKTLATFGNKYKISGNSLKRGKKTIYKCRSGYTLGTVYVHNDAVLVEIIDSHYRHSFVYMDKNGKHRKTLYKNLVGAS